MTSILIIEDDPAIQLALRDDLQFEGFAVEAASDGREGFELAQSGDFDLIILDLMLPGMNGLDVCRGLRQDGLTTPILMLTAARTAEMDKVLGFEVGADDYVLKPVGSRELVARVKAILKRSGETPGTSTRCDFGDVEADFKSYTATKAGRELHLTALEFRILKFLHEHQGEVVSRDAIIDAAWDGTLVSTRTVDTHIVRLRKKVEDDPSAPVHITGIRGVGYKFMG